mgnify:CR=1 FL=1
MPTFKSTTHGHNRGGKKTHVYNTWLHMKGRILNPNDKSYKNYGGRGLQIYEPWLKFENFLTDMGHPPSNKHSIERTDNNHGYFPDNCIWATRAIQAMNTQRSRYFTVNAETHCMAEWARRNNIKYSGTITNRLKRGCTLEEAVGLVPFAGQRRSGRRSKTSPIPRVG